MPSKTSKPRPSPPSPWKSAPACSEAQALEIARELASVLKAGDRVILEGPMGAGKTTFARALIEALGVRQPAEGSPSFAIAHEYDWRAGTRVVHIDFYRIKYEQEIEDAGLFEPFWDPQTLVICEWLSLWKGLEASVLESPDGGAGGARNWRVELAFSQAGDELRSLTVTSRAESAR